jgi:hypothetical protein
MEFERIEMPEDTVPSDICEPCSRSAIVHRATWTLVSYCPHSLTGAVLPRGREWMTVRGVELHAFKAMVARACVKGELLGDVAKAIGELLLEQAKRAGPPN